MEKYTGDANSSVNQRIKDVFVSRDVIMLASDIVEKYRGIELDIDGYDYIGTFNEAISKAYEKAQPVIAEGEEIIEVYEWYFVTARLADELEAKNEVIVSYFNSPLWGRQTTGQAISMDGIISEICAAMELLEGQKNEWKLV